MSCLFYLNLHASQSHPIELASEEFKLDELRIKIETKSTLTLKVLSDSDLLIGSQEDNGIVYNSTKYYTFEMKWFKSSEIEAKIFLYVGQTCVGHSIITKQLLTDYYGSLVVCCTSPGTLKPVAYVTFDYLIIEDTVEDEGCRNENLPKSFQYMGHRGCGKTIDRTARYVENTIDSFQKAFVLGANYVELDIQLTKDLECVIFHDDLTAVFLKNKKNEDQVTQIAVKDLTYSQIKSLKMDFARNGAGSSYDERFQKLFPTLEELFRSVDPCSGLFLEVKYTEPDQGIVGWMNKKVIVDRIIKETTRYSRIIKKTMFCSFDPEICLMPWEFVRVALFGNREFKLSTHFFYIKLQHRQSTYPVFFLTTGENAYTTTNPFEPYDMRTRTRKMAANFAIAHNLSGISINGDPLMNNKKEFEDLFKYLKDRNKLLFTWGSANSSKEYVNIQKSIGIAGAISDDLPSVL